MFVVLHKYTHITCVYLFTNCESEKYFTVETKPKEVKFVHGTSKNYMWSWVLVSKFHTPPSYKMFAP